jgi:hypothetical protein
LKYLILKESREKKAPSYLMAIKLLLEDQMATNEEFGFDKKIVLDNEGLKKIRSRIIDLTSELFIWGSDEVVNEWSLYRNDIKAKDDLVAQRGKIISLIRTELGYNQKIILPK